MNLRAVALAALMALTMAVPASAALPDNKTSDAEAFAVYAAEWTADRDAFLATFFQYYFASDAAEKSTLVYQVEDALVVVEKNLHDADVRDCFATYDELIVEFVGAFLRYFEVVGDNPALAEAQYQYANVLYTIIGTQFEPTLLECVGDV